MKKMKEIDLHKDVDLSGVKNKTKGTLNEFKNFALKGNLMDMAIGVIIGGAFGKIVTSLVNDVIMPLISLATGKIDFENMFYAFDGNTYATLAQAQEAGAVTLNYGNFLTVVMDFLIIALSIFFFVKFALTPRKKKEEVVEEAPVTTKECPYCKSTIHIDATKCPHCTSEQK